MARTGAVGGCQGQLELTGGTGRFVIRSEGYAATLVNGEIAWLDGQLTGQVAGQRLGFI